MLHPSASVPLLNNSRWLVRGVASPTYLSSHHKLVQIKGEVYISFLVGLGLQPRAVAALPLFHRHGISCSTFSIFWSCHPCCTRFAATDHRTILSNVVSTKLCFYKTLWNKQWWRRRLVLCRDIWDQCLLTRTVFMLMCDDQSVSGQGHKNQRR